MDTDKTTIIQIATGTPAQNTTVHRNSSPRLLALNQLNIAVLHILVENS